MTTTVLSKAEAIHLTPPLLREQRNQSCPVRHQVNGEFSPPPILNEKHYMFEYAKVETLGPMIGTKAIM